jgi:hypothetical protein
MNSFRIGNKTFTGPSCFDELSADQLKLWADLSLQKLTKRELLRIVGYRFSSIPAWYYFKLNRIQQCHIEDQYEFLFTEYTMTTWKYPIISRLFTTLYGPDGNLKNCTGAEFAYTDKYFATYSKSKASHDLDALIACMYRERGEGTILDVRKPFHHKEIQTRLRIVKRFPINLKYAIYLNYIGVRADMVKKHPHVFTNHTEQRVRSFGWPGIFYELAGDKLGKEEEVQNKYIWNLMAIMEMNEVRRIERERDLKINT